MSPLRFRQHRTTSGRLKIVGRDYVTQFIVGQADQPAVLGPEPLSQVGSFGSLPEIGRIRIVGADERMLESIFAVIAADRQFREQLRWNAEQFDGPDLHERD